MRSTHTYVVLDISPAAFAEIREKLTSAGYDHVFHETAKGVPVIDMHGIALGELPAPAACDCPGQDFLVGNCERCGRPVPAGRVP